MNIFSNIFGGGKVIEKGLDLIDSIHTSDVEEIEAKTKAKTELLNSYAPFKLAQRVIAFSFTITFLLCFFMVVWMTWFGDTKIDDIRAVISEFYVGEIMFTIIVFYFGGGFAEGAISKVKGKQS